MARDRSYDREYKRANYQKNRDRRLAQMKRRREENPAKVRAEKAAYYKKNRARLLAKQKKWYRENKAKVRQYRQSPSVKAKDIFRSKERYARTKGSKDNALTHQQWETIKEHYKHCCVYCGRKMKRLTIDHIVPLSKGGTHTVQNVVPACLRCNCRKKAGPPPKPVQPLLIA